MDRAAEKLAAYEANVKAYKEESMRAHIEKVNNLRDHQKDTIGKFRLHRFIVMDEAGQPKFDITPEEERAVKDTSSVQKRKAILGQSGVLKYLQPFYENSWNHKVSMSAKRVKHYVAFCH